MKHLIYFTVLSVCFVCAHSKSGPGLWYSSNNCTGEGIPFLDEPPRSANSYYKLSDPHNCILIIYGVSGSDIVDAIDNSQDSDASDDDHSNSGIVWVILEPVEALSYEKGVCKRPVGFALPDGFEWIYFYFPEHHDAKVIKNVAPPYTGETIIRSFYAHNMTAALRSASDYVLNDITWYVDGSVQGSADNGFCYMETIEESEYEQVKSNIETELWDSYHLVIQNCTDWVRFVVGD